MGTLKFTDVSNLDAAPPIYANAGKYGGRLRCTFGNHELAAGDVDVADIIVIARLPWTARVNSLKLATDAIASVSTGDIGLYYPDGTVASVQLFANDADLVSQTFGVENCYPGGVGIDTIGEPLWERAGLSEAPDDDGALVDIAITITALTTAAGGTLAWKIFYTLGD